MNGIILCGGNATRMGGIQKALLPLDGRTLIDWKIDLLEPYVDRILLVTNDSSSFEHLGYPCIGDIEPNIGPLMGIYSGLLHTDTEYNLFSSVDTPFLKEGLIEYLVTNGRQGDGTVPVWRGNFEPLCAVYAKSCLPSIEKTLHRHKVILFYEDADIRYIPEAEIETIDPEGISFLNINTHSEYRKAVELLSGSTTRNHPPSST